MLGNVLAAFVTGIFGLIVVIFGYVLNRQINLGIAEARLDKYASLWSAMKPTSPMDHKLGRRPPLSPEQREDLYQKMTDWYFDEKGGLVLSAATRGLYLTVKANLICQPVEFKPTSQQGKAAWNDERSHILLRQFSLLRTRMKADLTIYGEPFYDTLTADDRAFLEAAGQDPDRPPWRPRLWHGRGSGTSRGGG